MNKIWLNVLFNTHKKRTQLSVLKRIDKSKLRQDDMEEPFLCQTSSWKYSFIIIKMLKSFGCM